MQNAREKRNMWSYSEDAEGVVLRDVTLQTKKGGRPIRVIQLTDLHFNYCNEQDFDEANPVVMSTYENRKWLANGRSVANAQRCLEYAKEADQLVVTGDTLDYLSHGCIELAQTHLFSKHPGVMACLGNHEAVRRVQGTVQDSTTLASRLAVLQTIWPHDIYYSSRVLDERLMLIQMDNSTGGCFWECQIEPLQRDLLLARERGYTVLLFYHDPISTGNPSDTAVEALRIGDKSAAISDFYQGKGRLINADMTDASGKVYRLIVNNGDVIAGAFCGHKHNDFYTEILAKGADGSDVVIPQYVLLGVPYGKGHLLCITAK